MANHSSIEWTDATWNPVRGCSMAKGSEAGGCLNCYAARLAARGLPGLNSPTTGEPFAVIRDSGPRWTGKVELIESILELPRRWRRSRRIFVNSMSDLFHESLPDEAIDRVFREMASAREHTFQVLTKRPERALAYLGRFKPDGNGFVTRDGAEYETSGFIGNPARWPLPNVWLGISAEDQATADARIPLLLQMPAVVRFVSAEPLLGAVDLPRACRGFTCDGTDDGGGYPMRGIDLVIVGGESGPGARPMCPEWARSIRDQCQAAGVRYFHKQNGEWSPHSANWRDYEDVPVGDGTHHRMFHVGKRAAGRLLDGREWNEMPEARRG